MLLEGKLNGHCEYLFFLDGRQLYLCAVVKQKRYWVLV